MEDFSQFPDPPRPKPARPPAPRRVQLSVLTWLLIFLVLLLIFPSIVERVQYGITRARQRAKADVAKVVLRDTPNPSGRFVWVAKRIEPSVVGVETTLLATGQSMNDEWAYLYPESGEGSGVIVDEQGFIVTNYHVIENAAQVTVKLSDGRTVNNVSIVGADPEADLAVLKIEASGLAAAPWGDSDALEVGDEVLAVGNPYRLDRTVTAGIISAKGRPGVVGPLVHQEFLQTDAAVNPGNSGGPLVNMDGEVVGINTAIVGQSYRGISFAIPSNVAKDVYKHLKASGKVQPRGWLGVAMEEIDYRRAARLGLDRVLDHLYGVEVVGVVLDSPAHAAGLQPGDVILKWDGQEIHSPPELSSAVVRARVGTEVPVEIFRDGRTFEVRVKVGSRTLPLGRS
jgi:serine protease Do